MFGVEVLRGVFGPNNEELKVGERNFLTGELDGS